MLNIKIVQILTLNIKKIGQITLNTKPHPDPLLTSLIQHGEDSFEIW